MAFLLNRINKNENHIFQLDGLRFYAVLAVMICHWFTYTKLNYLNHYLGEYGVNFFFVLSGFLITRILIESKMFTNTNKKRLVLIFYARRFLRIFPLYYLIIFLGILFQIPNINKQLTWYIFYATNIILVKTNGGCENFNHLWSLAVEEQFYLFFPFFVILFKKENYMTIFSVMVFVGLFSRILLCLFYQGSDPFNQSLFWKTYALTPCCLDAFGIGAILAYLYIFNIKLLDKILRYNLIFIGCFVAALEYFVFILFRKTMIVYFILFFFDYQLVFLVFG